MIKCTQSIYKIVIIFFCSMTHQPTKGMSNLNQMILTLLKYGAPVIPCVKSFWWDKNYNMAKFHLAPFAFVLLVNPLIDKFCPLNVNANAFTKSVHTVVLSIPCIFFFINNKTLDTENILTGIVATGLFLGGNKTKIDYFYAYFEKFPN